MMASRFAAKSGRSKRVIVLGAGALVLAAGWAYYYLAGAAAPGMRVDSGGFQPVVAAAKDYAELMRTGQYQQALLKVAWVEDRLARVRAERGDAAAENEALAGLVGELTRVDRSNAVLRSEGIEDQYIFPARAQIEVAGADAGRGGLERKTSGRAWLRVTYPEPGLAPRDEGGRAIRSLTVGLNLSDDQKVLKAEIIGNLEIDRFSIRFF